VGESVPGLLQVRGQIPGLLYGPSARRMRGDAEQVDPPGSDLDDESRVQPFERDGVDREEVDGQQCVGLGVRNVRQVSSRRAGGGMRWAGRIRRIVEAPTR
jgi:hypothetical protein